MAARRLQDNIEPYMISATYHKQSGNIVDKTLPIILPHEILHLIWKASENIFMQRLVGPHSENGLRELREHCDGEPWLENHECKHVVDAMSDKCIPLKLHGDDAPVAKRSNGYVFLNFSPALVPFQQTAQSRCVIVAFSTEPADHNEFFEVLAWSLRSAALGVHPSVDHRGNAFEEGGARAKAAKHPIAGEYRFLLTQFAADWKDHNEVFHMDDNNYNKDSICFICLGTNSGGVMCAYNSRRDAPCLLAPTTHE